MPDASRVKVRSPPSGSLTTTTIVAFARTACSSSRPSHAAAAMEMGYDAVLLNTAVAKAGDPVAMARAFAQAVEAGALARGADPMEPRDMAAASTPEIGKAFLQ